MEPTRITSAQNPRVKDAARLREGSARRETGLYLVEGERELARALAAGVSFRTVFHAPELHGARAPGIAAALDEAERRGVELVECAPGPFAKLSGRENPDGVVGVAVATARRLDDCVPGPAPFVLVVEGVEKPGNLGALLRTADAAGVDLVVVTDPAADLHNPHAIRASQGASFSVPTVVATNDELAGWLARHGIAVVATTPSADALLWDLDLRGPVAILLGSEAHGLGPFWLEPAAGRPAARAARLPMAGSADSLNVAATAAICLFEAVRQRAQNLTR